MIRIIEYLIHTGQLTGTTDNVRLQDDGNGVYVKEWTFPEPQPDFTAVEASQGYIDYVNQRAAIISRKHAREVFDTTIKRYALVSIDEINALRSWVTGFKAAVAAATTLADLKTRVAALPNLPQRTPDQLKTAMDAKD